MGAMKRSLLITAILIVLISLLSFALDLSFYNSFKTLCMGETFTGIANDENALFYNPAGLANGNGWVLKLPNMDTDMSYGAASATVKALTHIDEIKSVLNSGDNVKIGTYFLNNYSKTLSGRNDLLFRSNAYLGYEGDNFAGVISAIGQGYGTSFVSEDIIPFISLHAKAAAYVQASAAAAFGMQNLKISFGGTYRYGYVMPHIYSIDNLSILMVNSSTFDPDLTYEATSDADLGVKISWKNVTFGGLWHGILNPQDSNVRIGVGYASKVFSIGIDFEKLFDNRYSFFRRLHMGLQYTPFDFVHFYGGLSAGWLTGGVKLNIGSLGFYVGTYVLNYGYHAGYDYQRMYTIGFEL